MYQSSQNRRIQRLLLPGAVLLVASFIALPALGQLGPRTLGNQNLDTAAIGDQLSISAADKTTQKMDLVRDLSYLEPAKWKSSSVTWLHFEKAEDGSVAVTEMGPGVVGGVSASGKWNVEAMEDGGWKAVPKKKSGKLDLYLETKFRGEDFKVGAVIPKFDDEAYGAVYRGTDFLFFVTQKKHPDS
ncbi:MAG: hypothetical protein AAF481_11565 [Acidobacteriota bacterium]